MGKKIKINNWRRVVHSHSKKTGGKCIVCGKPIPPNRVCCNQCYSELY